MARSDSARLSIGGRLIVAAATCALLAGCGSATGARTSTSPEETTGISSPTPASVTPSIAPSATSTGPTTYDTAALEDNFPLPMTVDLPEHWRPLPPPDFGPRLALTFVHTGTPADDPAQWWGPDLDLVDGAEVIDPRDIGTPVAADDRRLPWPDSYVDYLAALPSVEVVSAPEPVTIGGAEGRQATLKTPPMHPTVFLEGDTAWLGGGATGFDPGLTRKVIELDVNGQHLLFTYADGPASFDKRVAEVNTIIESMTFER